MALMPTLQRLPGMSVRVNVPDHPPPHVHVVLADRRDALVDIMTLAVTSRTLDRRDIALALAWIEAHQAHCLQVFKECNPP